MFAVQVYIRSYATRREQELNAARLKLVLDDKARGVTHDYAQYGENTVVIPGVTALGNVFPMDLRSLLEAGFFKRLWLRLIKRKPAAPRRMQYEEVNQIYLCETRSCDGWADWSKRFIAHAEGAHPELKGRINIVIMENLILYPDPERDVRM